MTHEKTHNGNRVVKWLVDKILPWILMAVIGFGFEMVTWRVQVNDKIEHLESDKRVLIGTIQTMKAKMDIAVSTASGGHMTHREYNILTQSLERRLELLSEFHVKQLSRLEGLQRAPLEDPEDKSN